MERRFSGWRVLVATLLLTATATAQDSPLSYFGENVHVLIRLKEPDRVIENVGKLVNRIQPGFGDLATSQAMQALGRTISSSHLTGVDQSRDWYVGVYFSEEAEPALVFAIPAITADDLIAGLDEEMTTEVRGNYVLYTESAEFPSATGSAETKLTGEALAAFERGMLSLYFDAERLVPLYSSTIDSGRDRVLELLNQMRNTSDFPKSELNSAALVELLGNIADKAFQAIEDSREMTVSVSVSDQDVDIEEFIAFQNDSKTVTWLARHQPTAMPELKALPEGAATYVGLSTGNDSIMRWSTKLFEGTDEDKNSQAAELAKSVDGMTVGASVSAIRFTPDGDGSMQMLSITTAGPREKLQAIARFGMEMQESETIAGREIDVGIMKTGTETDSALAEAVERKEQALFGAQGMVLRIAYLDDGYAWTMGGGQPVMSELLGRIDSAAVNPLLSPLTEPANLVALIDIPTLIAESVRTSIRSSEFPIPLDEGMLDSLNLQPSHVRFIATAAPQSVTLTTHIPVETMIGIAKIALLGRSAFEGSRF